MCTIRDVVMKCWIVSLNIKKVCKITFDMVLLRQKSEEMERWRRNFTQ